MLKRSKKVEETKLDFPFFVDSLLHRKKICNQSQGVACFLYYHWYI